MLQVLEARSDKDLLQFIKYPLSLYSEDPFYAPLPIFEQKKIFSAKNPFFKDARVRFYTCVRGGKVAGRVCSIINRRHLALHNDGAGFFGFYESADDPEAARALIGRVEEDLRGAGLNKMIGPMNFSTNEECGFLLEGFDEPPMIMTPHNPPCYNRLMEECMMRKAKDLFAFIHELREELPEKILRVASIAERRGVTVRPINLKDLRRDLRDFRVIYNGAWKDNWGFIPLTEEEADDMAKRMRGILVPELTLVAEKDGGPAGFLGMVPDMNQVLRILKGRLNNPLRLAKALAKFRKTDGLRILLLGIKEEYRNRGVDALLFREGFRGIKKFGGRFRRVEFSWILEDNQAVINLTEMIGSRLYKRYRVYEKAL